MNKFPPNISFGLDDVVHLIEKNQYSSIGILVDENTLRHCYPKIKDRIPEHVLCEIPSGEINKNINTCSQIWQVLTDHGFDRKSSLINLGGGVIGDMGGFCASTFKRGIAFINMPTTLLSQVDASVGGKLGIDFNGLKNHIGLFHDPVHVAIDPVFLETLPENELLSGFAEVIKHHLIRDSSGWDNLKTKPWNTLDWNEIIPHSVAIKSAVVESDPFENGERKILNLGHTIGHAIESYLLNSQTPVLHGEAVAAGILCENYISSGKGMLSEEDKLAIEKFILSLYGKINIPKQEFEGIIHQAYQDKKNQNKQIQAVLLQNIGEPVWDQTVSAEEVIGSLKYYVTL